MKPMAGNLARYANSLKTYSSGPIPEIDIKNSIQSFIIHVIGTPNVL